MDTFTIKGREKIDNKKIINLGDFKIKGREKVDNRKIINSENFRIKSREKVDNRKIIKSENFRIKSREKKDNRKIINSEAFLIKGREKVDNKKVANTQSFKIRGRQKVDNKQIISSEKIQIRGKKEEKVEKIVENKIMTSKIVREPEAKKLMVRSIKNDRFQIKGKEQKVVKNRIIKNEKIEYKGKVKKVVKNRILRYDRIQLKGLEKEEEEKIPEDNIEESVIEVSYIKKPKKVMPNKIKKLERFKIKGVEPSKKVENIENLRISKAYSTKQEVHEFNDLRIGRRLEVSLYGIKKKEKIVKTEKKVEKDWNKLLRSYTATKLFIRRDYDKVKMPEQEIIEKEEIETVEKIYKNWNDQNRPIKSTKLNVKGTAKLWDNLEMEQNDQFKLLFETKPKKIEKKVEKIEKKVEKEKVEFVIQSFSFKISDRGKKFRESLHIENGVFDLEGNKGMTLKEDEAQTIKISKEQVLKPKRVSQFNLLSKIKKVEKVFKIERMGRYEIKKPKIILKSIKENRLFIKGLKTKQVVNEKIKTAEKIVEVEKKIDWNLTNKIENKGKINIFKKRKQNISEKQKTNTISLIGSGIKDVQIIEKIVKEDWTNSLRAQRNSKFALYGKEKRKKDNLIVVNGKKFLIKKESKDEIIYNDDYNTRSNKNKLKDQNENEGKIIKEKEIIKEREIIPKYQREVRAQISRLKEESSETSSSISDIDVLATIKNKKMIGYSAAAGEIDTALIGYKKTGEFKGYQTKVINGEVVFTAKNGIGVKLGGTQYQKQIKTNAGYTKKITNISSNKMSGIEIINPNVKSEIYYQKMTGAS